MNETSTLLRLRLEERPTDSEARCALARLMKSAGDQESGLALLREGILYAQNQTEALLQLAETFAEFSETPEAIALLQSFIRVQPDMPEPYQKLSDLWATLGESQKAQQAFAQAQARGGKGALAIGSDGPTPLMVRHLFDQYADRFDDQLVGTLEYRVPGLMDDFIKRHVTSLQDLTIVDIGCGTGLMGSYLRPYAKRLIGVDLSPAMLAKAKEKTLYDELHEANIVTYLQNQTQAIDLIVAADVLVYIENLQPIFRAATHSLKDKGAFVASVESTKSDEPVLTEGRRYAHSETYISKNLLGCNLALTAMETITPRKDRGSPIDGALFLSSKEVIR